MRTPHSHCCLTERSVTCPAPHADDTACRHSLLMFPPPCGRWRTLVQEAYEAEREKAAAK